MECEGTISLWYVPVIKGYQQLYWWCTPKHSHHLKNLVKMIVKKGVKIFIHHQISNYIRLDTN